MRPARTVLSALTLRSPTLSFGLLAVLLLVAACDEEGTPVQPVATYSVERSPLVTPVPEATPQTSPASLVSVADRTYRRAPS